MKWLKRIASFMLLMIALIVGIAVVTAVDSEKPVGFQVTQASGKDGAPLAIGVWYPTNARAWPTTFIGTGLMKVAKDSPIAGNGLPLVVISHGNGGGMMSHVDLALALASAGYVVAAPMHAGDNFLDQAGVGSADFFNLRSQQYLTTIEHVLTSWAGSANIDHQRVGAYGMSMGGFSVLTAVGAQPDLRTIASHCTVATEFVCDVLRHFKSPYVNAQPKSGQSFVADSRIKAAVLAAPGLGFTMAGAGLAHVRVPIQLWVAENDDKVRDPGPVRQLGNGQLELHSVPGAGHLSFLAPCSGVLRPPAICSDADDFDRKAFHASMNAGVIAFFGKHLK